ncbi:MAG: hypothetical protein KDD82_05645 [Planctomycetes bacterium]|nr:hypothetical protein [Planctomycetota bacterium]
MQAVNDAAEPPKSSSAATLLRVDDEVVASGPRETRTGFDANGASAGGRT